MGWVCFCRIPNPFAQIFKIWPTEGIAVRLKAKIIFLPQRGFGIKPKVAAKAATLGHFRL